MRDRVTNPWFFRDTSPLLKLLLIFVNGDLLFLFPLVILIGSSYFFSVKFGLLMTGSYISVRFLGEIVYWMGQQFGERKYRPNDFGLTNLDNHAAYILYQTFATCGVMLGLGLIFFTFLYL